MFEIERGNATTNALDSTAARGGAISRPFTVFRNQRWRPDLPPPGGANEIIAYGLIVLMPIVGVAALIYFAKRLRRTARPPTTLNLIVGNVLVFGTLAGLTCATAETYFRFFYDTTDSLGSTRVSERWVQRHWHVNAAGVRDDIEYSPGLDDGKRRLSFVGDSFTAGHGIKQVEDRFPNLLRQAHPDWQIHVLANVGLDTGAEIVLVNKLAAKGYAFDRVVLVYCLNDIGDLVSQQGEAFTRMIDGMAPGNWLTRNSYALNLFTQRYQAGRNPYVRNYFSFVREAYQGETWELQKARLREFRAAVESRGGRLAVVTFPFLDALGPDYAYKTVHEELDRFWRELGVPHLDLLPRLCEPSGPRPGGEPPRRASERTREPPCGRGARRLLFPASANGRRSSMPACPCYRALIWVTGSWQRQSKPMIQVEGLTKLYGDFVAVNEVTFTVNSGEVMGLVGPNGAGKTTSLRCLSGIIPALPWNDPHLRHGLAQDPIAAKRQIAFFNDEPRLFDYLTVEQHLAFTARLYQVADYAPFANELLRELELEGKRQSLPGELSRGMKQKLAIACGLLHSPRVLYFDEPLTGLDPLGIRRMKDSILRRAQAGAAIIISSHLLHLVQEICSHILILKNGRKVIDGTLEEITQKILRPIRGLQPRGGLLSGNQRGPTTAPGSQERDLNGASA